MFRQANNVFAADLCNNLIVYTIRIYRDQVRPEERQSEQEEARYFAEQAEDFDFEEALYSIDDREDCGEIRYRAIGLLDARLYALVFVDEEEGGNIRAISLRKATKHEAKGYKENR